MVLLLCCFLSPIRLFPIAYGGTAQPCRVVCAKRFWRGAPAVRSPFLFGEREHTAKHIDAGGNRIQRFLPAGGLWHGTHAHASRRGSYMCTRKCVRIGHTRLAKFLHNEAPAEEVCRGGRW